jgi:predicted membrane metal-binding protein
MFWTAGFALVLQSLGQHLLGGGLPPVPVQGAAVSCLVVWLLFGQRCCLVVLPSVWACLWAGWVLDDRLAPPLAGEDVVLQGTVCSIPKISGRAVRFVIATRGGSAGVDWPRRVYVGWYESGIVPATGEYWQLNVRLRRPISNGGPLRGASARRVTCAAPD